MTDSTRKFIHNAALLLLDEHPYQKKENKIVFIIGSKWLSNWLHWASSSLGPNDPIQANIAKCIDYHQLQAVHIDKPCDPAPIDNRELLALDESVRLVLTNTNYSCNTSANTNISNNDNNNKTDQQPVEVVSVCAVSEEFYEFLRRSHGVLCCDLSTISWQKLDSSSSSPSLPDFYSRDYSHKRPIDFPRCVIDGSIELFPVEVNVQVITSCSIITQQSGNNSAFEIVSKQSGDSDDSLETHINIDIQTLTMKNDNNDDGNALLNCNGTATSNKQKHDVKYHKLLASRRTKLQDVRDEIMRTFASNRSKNCIRMWYENLHEYVATQLGDGYELFTENSFNGDNMTIQEWFDKFNKKPSHSQSSYELNLIIEIRDSSNDSWYRKQYELSERINIGDFVDAQDTTGKWYESVVTHVNKTHVKVHYLGWNSRWDSFVPLQTPSKPSPLKHKAVRLICPPAPLWTFTVDYRKQLKPGSFVDIRDSTSRVHVPKWFQGEILKIEGKNENIQNEVEGAELEKGVDGKHIKLLNKVKMALVQVECEKSNVPQNLLSILKEEEFNIGKDSNKLLVSAPPYRRWVNLYSEEVCAPNTHNKLTSLTPAKTLGSPVQANGVAKHPTTQPVTIQYALDPKRAPVEVMKSHLGKGYVRESIKGIPLSPGCVGLQNLGNTCYMNSILQCMFQIPFLTDHLLSKSYTNEINMKNPLGSGGIVVKSYAFLLRDIFSNNYTAVAPRNVVQSIGGFAPQFANSYQHDSQEFCSVLMDGIHEDLNKVLEKPYVDLEVRGNYSDSGRATISWKKHLQRHDSIIVDHFQGMHKSHLTCIECGHESSKFEVYSQISLPLPEKLPKIDDNYYQTTPLSACIDAFTSTEQLDTENAWFCPGCNKHQCAKKLITLWSSPDILILHLKRFTHHSRSKVEHLIDFPIDRLDLSPYIKMPNAPNSVYRLLGVSEHHGSSVLSGHYTATVRNAKSPSQWHRFNDTNVGITSAEASHTGGAYLLFYERIGGNAKWGGMEDFMKDRGAVEADKDGFVTVERKGKGGRARR